MSKENEFINLKKLNLNIEYKGKNNDLIIHISVKSNLFLKPERKSMLTEYKWNTRI